MYLVNFALKKNQAIQPVLPGLNIINTLSSIQKKDENCFYLKNPIPYFTFSFFLLCINGTKKIGQFRLKKKRLSNPNNLG